MKAGLVACTALLVAFGVAACSLRAGSGPSTADLGAVDVPSQDLKIGTARAGIYRLDVDLLSSRGLLPSGVLLDQAALYRDGQLVATWKDASGRTLVFYGSPPSSRYAPFAVYVLRWDSGNGRSVPVEEMPLAPGGPPALATEVLELEENSIYIPRAVRAVPDPWFWARLAPGSPTSLLFQLPTVGKGEGSLTVGSWGATANQGSEPDHNVMVSLNGVQLGPLAWDGETVGSRSWTFSSNMLMPGDNELGLEVIADTENPADLSYLDWVKVTFPTATVNGSDFRVLTVGPGRLVTDPDDLILDLSDPGRPVDLRVPPQGGLLESERMIAVIPPGGGWEPDLVAPMTKSSWADGGHHADLLIVAPADFIRTLAPLVTARRAQGLTTILIPVEELGDEFGGGIATPEALHSFLAHALETWVEPAPRYLLLVGEATYDFRDYLGQGQRHLVPSMVIPVAYGGETLSDTALADLDGDGRPELAIGRWPVSDKSQVAALIRRTLEYEQQGTTAPEALFVADTSEPTFSAISDRLIDVGGLGSVATRLYGVSSQETIRAWNQGAWLINYVGHGSLDLWGKTGLLTITSLKDLTPAERPPIVTQFTCLAGFFGHPRLTSLSEAMLGAQNGPVATVAATSLTLAAHQEGFAAALVAELTNPETLRIGDALLRAQRSSSADSSGGREVVATFHLLGDPALIIARPD
jgi:hypothetical protein